MCNAAAKNLTALEEHLIFGHLYFCIMCRPHIVEHDRAGVPESVGRRQAAGVRRTARRAAVATGGIAAATVAGSLHWPDPHH